MNISRRNLLKLGSAATAALAAGALPRSAKANPQNKIPIGLQLYSVRHDCERDLPAVIEAVAKMGYRGVEFAGYYGRTAKQLRKLLDANGLVCCGTHLAVNTLTGDALSGTVEFNQILGNKYLIVSSLPGTYRNSVEALKETAELFSTLAEKVKPQGMRVGYHAHGADFRRFDGQTGWDIFFSHASSEVVMQLDVGNCIEGGGDPIAVLKKFPGRSATIHLKEHGGPPQAALGEGDVDWNEVFRLCETSGGTKWYIVEHERPVGKPLDNVRRCLENLRKMGKVV